MRQQAPGTSIESHALECVAAVAIALLAADAVREALYPFWRTLRLLFGI